MTGEDSDALLKKTQAECGLQNHRFTPLHLKAAEKVSSPVPYVLGAALGRDGIVDGNYMSDPVLHGSILRTFSRGWETR